MLGDIQHELKIDPDRYACRVLPNRTAPITLEEFSQIENGRRYLDEPRVNKLAGHRFWYINCETKPTDVPVLDGRFVVIINAESGRGLVIVY